MQINGHHLIIIAVYAPGEDADRQTKDYFYEKLNNVLMNIKDDKEICILGDLNARTGSEENGSVVGKYGEQTRNNNGERLVNFCQGMSLKIMNGFFQHKNIHKFTWTQPTRGISSIIDYVIMRQNSKINILDVRAYRGPECGSDHHFVLSKLIINYRRTPSRKAQMEKKETSDERIYNLESFRDESTQFLYKLRLATKLQHVRKDQDANELYKELKTCIHEAAEEALGLKEHQKKNPEWWTKETEALVMEKKNAYHCWLHSQKEVDRKTYMRLNREVKKQVDKNKNELWEKKCEEVGRFMGGTRVSEAWKMIKTLRKDERQNTKISLIEMEEWKEYYEKLLVEKRRNFMMKNRNIDMNSEETVDKITQLEIKTALKKCKNKKAAGPGSIPIELIKNGPDILIELIEELFNKCLFGDQVPKEWNLSYISSIFKKGDKKLCQNYRGISVISSMGRLYGRILKTRIESVYQDIEEQSGFRAGRSCLDNIFVLQQIMEKRMARNLATHLVFIDLEKAYDNVPLKKLFEVLEDVGLSKIYIGAIWNLYKDAEGAIKIGKDKSEPFPISKGLKQGCTMSPTLFKIYIQEALKDWRKKTGYMGIEVDDQYLTSLYFADDQVIIACDEDDADYMLRKIKQQYEDWGLSLNMTKTEYMKVGGHGEIEDTELQIRELRRTDCYKYLGSILSAEGTTKKDIEHRIQQGKKVTQALNSLLWSKNMRVVTKIKIFEAIVEPILTYGAECWQMSISDKEKIDVVEMDFLRRACRISRLDRVRNEDIRRRTGRIFTTSERIESRQLIWYGHVQRMGDQRWPKRAMKYTPQNRRKRGRPKISWKDGITNIMRDRAIEEGEWKDKDKWRSKCGMRQRP